MTGILTVIAAVVIFAVLIMIHELGHFFAAKWSGVRVREFAIGMGPKLWGHQGKETFYSIRAIPIGGFCAMEGEDTTSDDKRALTNKPAWVRLIILAAGAVMNIVLGFVLLLVVLGSSPKLATTTVESVEPGQPAQIAGLQAGDEIVKINRSKVHLYNDILFTTSSRLEEPVDFYVKRDGETVKLTMTANAGVYGFRVAQADNSVFRTIHDAYYGTGFYSKVILSTVLDLFRGKVNVADLSGPIGIVSEINNAVQDSVSHGWAGFQRVLDLAILLTINLGIFNLLPIPALDGGRILFVLVEMIRRKPLPPEKEGLVHMIGFAALILLSIFIAFQDIIKLW